MLEPDPTSRVPIAHAGAPPSTLGPHALQILTTEHWSLLAARSLVYTEAMSRTAIFVASLSSSVVALALVGQATEFETGFVVFALVLLPVVYFLGLVTIARLSQVNREDARWVQGMNRIRHAYLELAPELEAYFVTSPYDDRAGVLQSAMAIRRPPGRVQAFIAVPGAVAVVNSVVAGATAGIAGVGLDLGAAGCLAVGGGFFLLSIASFFAWARHAIPKSAEQLDTRFPSQPSSEGTGAG